MRCAGGHAVPEGFYFCPQCGAAVRCPNGHARAQGALSCPDCGQAYPSPLISGGGPTGDLKSPSMSPDDPPPPPSGAAEKVPVSYTPPSLPAVPSLQFPPGWQEPPVVPPKKHHRGRNWTIAVSVLGLTAVIGLSFALSAPFPPASSATATTIPATTIPATPAASYLVALDLANPAFDNEGAYALFAVGHAMCQMFSGGDTVAEVDDYSIESDNNAGDVFTASEVGDLVGAAVTYLCPAYLSEVQSYDAGM